MTALVNSGKCSTYIGIDINEGMLYHAKQKATQLRAVENQVRFSELIKDVISYPQK